MNKPTIPVACLLLSGIVLLSGCGNQAKRTDTASQSASNESSSAANSSTSNMTGDQESSPPSATSGEDAAATNTGSDHDASSGNLSNEASSEPSTDSDSAASSKDILIIIDQTEKPIENAGMFNFSIQHLPEGYRLEKMSWTGKGKAIINTYEQAIENGGMGGAKNGSFYISGDGQFSGFSYPESRKGEQGVVAFTFVNDAGHELKWEKQIVLK